MKKAVSILLLSFLLVLPAFAEYQVGDHVPDFTLFDVVSNQNVSLYDYSGQVILLNFFASW